VLATKLFELKGQSKRLHLSSGIEKDMSHFTTITTQIKDINALRASCNELGLGLIQNSSARRYINNQIKGEYVIQLKGPYDIAVNKNQDGTYGLTTDWWDGHVEKEVGANFGKLLQLYGVHKTMLEARKKGLSVLRRAKQDGSIKLVVMGV
jgi:hypothetical protein